MPSYFLADLPPEAELTAALITEAGQTLKRNRERYLQERTTDSIIRVLDGVGRDWLTADYPYRRLMLEAGPAATGFPAAILEAGLDAFFNQLTAHHLERLLAQELGHPQRLDNFFAEEHDRSGERTALALGPELIVQVAPADVPLPTMKMMVFALLARAAQFVKCPWGSAFLPTLFAHSLYEADHKVGACIEIAGWRGGAALDAALFSEADCVVATASDDKLEAIRHKLPRRTRLVGYTNRVSFAYVTKDALERHARRIVHEAATDIAAWNQLGFLSPHVIYVEENAAVPGERFAAMLAEQLEAVEKTHPRGQLGAEQAAGIALRRSVYEVRAANVPETKMWASVESNNWTVIYENDPQFQVSCLNRFIYVKTARNLTEALNGAEMAREHVSTVGLAASAAQMPELARKLARWGAKRICPLGQMQVPPLDWRHDGRPALGDLITWCDWER